MLLNGALGLGFHLIKTVLLQAEGVRFPTACQLHQDSTTLGDSSVLGAEGEGPWVLWAEVSIRMSHRASPPCPVCPRLSKLFLNSWWRAQHSPFVRFLDRSRKNHLLLQFEAQWLFVSSRSLSSFPKTHRTACQPLLVHYINSEEGKNTSKLGCTKQPVGLMCSF